MFLILFTGYKDIKLYTVSYNTNPLNRRDFLTNGFR